MAGIADYSATAENNTAVGGISIAEGMAPGNVNDAMSAIMADLASFYADAYYKGSILGTVSESSGVPTGAVIERDSNANGEYVRFADGTQICTRTITDLSLAIDTVYFGGYRTSAQSWTYPAAFDTAADAGFVMPTAASAFGGAFNTLGATSVTWFLTTVAVSAAANRSCRLCAIGRWFT